MTPTLISMFLWNWSWLRFFYWYSRLVLKSCKCVKYYFTTISYFFCLFPRRAQETPGMFWDPCWLLPKYGVAIVYFPFHIHMISFNSSRWGHPNSAKNSFIPWSSEMTTISTISWMGASWPRCVMLCETKSWNIGQHIRPGFDPILPTFYFQSFAELFNPVLVIAEIYAMFSHFQ